MRNLRILIVEDEETAGRSLAEFLGKKGYEVVNAFSLHEASGRIVSEEYEAILLDVRLPDGNGMDLVPRIRERSAETVVVLMTAYAAVEDAVRALKWGADQYLLKPLDLDELLLVLERECEVRTCRAENRRLRAYVRSLSGPSNLVGSSPAMRPIFEMIRKTADSNANILLTGESGTGKGLVARTIHFSGLRQDARFVPVHCAALPEPLLESELFGHVKGAFTGAMENHQGRFEYADGGTVFFDEIGELPPSVQVKLLRVIQERSFERLGSNREIRVDVRIIASTNRDLGALVEEGVFREDLFWRINVVRIHLPPLRDRKEDIPLLARRFLAVLSEKAGDTVPDVDEEVWALFRNYDWPGNVRELENTLERAVTLMDDDRITPDSLPSRLRNGGEEEASDGLRDRVKEFEREVVREILEKEDGNRHRTAERLGVSLRTLQNKIKEYGLDG